MPAATRVALETLGCKLNQAEAESLVRELEAAGFNIVAPEESCDVYILNACTVTATADTKARHLLRRAFRNIPSPVLVITGCYDDNISSIERAVPGAQIIICRDKTVLVPRLRALGYGGAIGGSRPPGRTRAFVKAQEGCRNFCAYCIVPLMRGREISLPLDDIASEVRARVQEGYREIVLTGTEIGAYRHNYLGLPDLVRHILEETGVARLRLSSLQPAEVTEALLKLGDSGRLCPHFHLSLQSGSGSVLRRMRRRYDVAEYHEAIVRIRAMFPEAAVTTDVIVGFPGETDAEFEDSLGLCASLGFARIHVFPFSPRPGTAAAAFPDPVATVVKRERCRRMLALAKESAEAFRTRFLGKTLSVLWETWENGVLSGYSENYIRVYAKAGVGLVNEIMTVGLTKPYRDGVWGEILGGAL